MKEVVFRRGFSLLELTVYLALCSLLMVMIMGFLAPTVSVMRDRANLSEHTLLVAALMRLITQDLVHAPADRRAWDCCREGEIRWKGERPGAWYVRQGRLYRMQAGEVTVVADGCRLEGRFSPDFLDKPHTVYFVDVALSKDAVHASRRVNIWEGFLRCSS